MARCQLQTFYACTREPHVVGYDDVEQAHQQAEHVHKVHAGVSHTIIRPVEDHEGLVPIYGCRAVQA
jgi:hypothetical protein